MRKITSIATVVLAGLLIAGCSSKKDDFSNVPTQDLYEKGQSALQSGDYNSSIRYLDAITGRAGGYGEQALISLVYANYKIGEYYKGLDAAERFARAYPNSANMDYVHYLAGLSYARLGDNFIQDFFHRDPSERATSNIRNAYGNFQAIVQHYPQSRYVQDSQNWMVYLKERVARHELDIAKFYMKRDAYVAVANRITGLLKDFPDSKATFDALPLLKTAYEKMGIQDSAQKVAEMIEASKDKTFPEITKPAYGEQF